jgi:hypothetical protein
MNPFQFLGNYVERTLPYVQEYGNALLSPFSRQGLYEQPLGGSGIYGQNPDGTARSMGQALDYIGAEANRRNQVIEQLRRR